MAPDTVAAGPVVGPVAAGPVAGPVAAGPVAAGPAEPITPFMARCEEYTHSLPLAGDDEMVRHHLSIQDEMDKSDAFHTMTPGSYEIFACHHQMSYALYCALDGTVWMFEVDCQTPQTRSIVTLADLYPWTR